MADILDQWTIFQDVIKDIAEIKGWNVEYTTNYWVNELNASQRWHILSEYGFSPVRTYSGNIVGWTRAAEGVAESAGTITAGTAPQVMQVVETQNGVALQTLPQTTTATNATIKGGGAMTALKVANAALLTAAIGGAVVRDYKTHTEWWNDLSDAVFQKGEFAGVNLGGTMPTYPSDWNGVDAAIDVVRVMNRRVEDSLGLSTNYSYMSATDVAVMMQALAAQGAYNQDDIEYQDYDIGPHQELIGNPDDMYSIAHHINSLNNVYFSLESGVMITSNMVDEAIRRARNLAPLDSDCIRIQAGFSRGARTMFCNVALFKSMPDGSVYETQVGTGTQQQTYKACTTGTCGTCSVEMRYGSDTPTYNTGTSSSTTCALQTVISTQEGFQYIFGSNVGAVWVEGGIPEQGIYPDPYAQAFEIGTAATIAEVIAALQDQYPDWWGEGFSTGTYDPDSGDFGSEYWLPVSIPWTDPNSAPYNIPEGYDQPYAQTGRPWPDPDTTPTGYGTPYPYGWDIPYTAPTVPYYFPNNPTPVPTDTPSSPSTPPAVTGSSNALWAVYNPTFSEVSAVGSYLWSSSIIDIIQKFFSNPMDAIISLHMIYTTPATGASQNIKLGYLDSGVSAKIVTNQYKIIDCGEILVPEYFQDVRDYSPYCKVDIFLPFIGIRSLAPEDVINCKLRVKYTVDVLTGAILAELYVTKRGATQCLYTFAGNGAVQIPLTGGDRTRLLSGIIAGATSVMGGAAIGGLAGAAAGAVHGVSGLHNSSSVERTGNFSANAGAMGIKTPYLIINRKDAYDAVGYNRYYGFPCNIACRLSECTGYTKVNTVHVDIFGALEEEKADIEAALHSGVVIS